MSKNKIFEVWQATQLQRVSDGQIVSILDGCKTANLILAIALPQLGDFDSLEYVWWPQQKLSRELAAKITIRAVGIGDRNSGQKFCQFTGFPESSLSIDPNAKFHRSLGLYEGLVVKLPILSSSENWVETPS